MNKTSFIVRSLGAALGLCIATTAIALAQPAKPYLQWNQVATTLAEAQALTFNSYLDGSSTAVALTGVTCSGATSPYLCTAPLPAFAPGVNHTLQLTAKDTIGESAKSTAIPFGPPAIPNNGVIQK